MDCSLRACKNITSLIFIGLLLLTSGCRSGPDDSGHLSTRNLSLAWQGKTTEQQLYVQAGLELGLSEATISALESGVPLTITMDFRLGRRYSGWAREVSTQSFHWRIRYLPLSEHYALENPISNATETYPRLRTLLTALRLPSWYPTQVGIPEISDNNYQMQVRTRLNRLQLPPPLRLPAMFSAQWRLHDRWHTLLIPMPNNSEEF